MSSIGIRSLVEERESIDSEMRKILSIAEVENRNLTSEESEKYDDLDERWSEITQKLNRKKKEKKSSQRYKNEPIKPDPSDPCPGYPGRSEVNRRFVGDGELWVYPPGSFRASTPLTLDEERDMANVFRYGRSAETRVLDITSRDPFIISNRALQGDLDQYGGFLLPTQFSERFIETKMDMTFMRQIATIIVSENAVALEVGELANDPEDFDWTPEIQSGSADSTMSFEQRALRPHPLAKRLLVSKTLLRLSNAEEIVRRRLAYKYSLTEEKAYLADTAGGGRPVGVFSDTSQGISSARWSTEGSTSTNVTADSFIACKYNLKQQYRNNAASVRWILSRECVKRARKLKSSAGDYIWKSGLGDKSDTILEVPYFESEWVPDTFTAGLPVGIIGDFSYYWIYDSLNFTIAVATELHLETNQNGFYARGESDGCPVLEDAFSVLALAS